MENQRGQSLIKSLVLILLFLIVIIPTQSKAQIPLITGWDTFGFSSNGGRDNTIESVISPSNISNMALKFKFATGGPVYSSAAVDSGVLYFGADTGYVYALDMNSGAIRWQYKTAAYISSSPAPHWLLATFS